MKKWLLKEFLAVERSRISDPTRRAETKGSSKPFRLPPSDRHLCSEEEVFSKFFIFDSSILGRSVNPLGCSEGLEGCSKHELMNVSRHPSLPPPVLSPPCLLLPFADIVSFFLFAFSEPDHVHRPLFLPSKLRPSSLFKAVLLLLAPPCLDAPPSSLPTSSIAPKQPTGTTRLQTRTQMETRTPRKSR